MDEESTKKVAEVTVNPNRLIDSLKLRPTTQKIVEVFYQIPKIPDFNMPSPELLMPERLEMPDEIPTQEEINIYQSASALMEALSNEALRWKKQLPENYKPTILALLNGGLQINVQALSQVSFHGIQIQGTLNNGASCSLLAHQSTVQMLCYGAEITEETPNRPIGFIWSGHNVEV